MPRSRRCSRRTTNSLREALASSNARGQWGERMAEDVLRLAGFHEGVNYHKRTAVVGEGTRHPRLHVPAAEGSRAVHGREVPDGVVPQVPRCHDRGRAIGAPRHVRPRCAGAGCASSPAASTPPPTTGRRSTTCCCSCPTKPSARSSTRATTGLIEEAMASNVVICSPLTLFAFLGVIRQAFDNFVIEETSQEILQLLGKFGQQWGKYTESVDKVKRQFDTLNRSFDELATTRRRQLERPLNAIDDLRRKQQLPIDGQLFGDRRHRARSTTCANSAPDGPEFLRESGGVRLRSRRRRGADVHRRRAGRGHQLGAAAAVHRRRLGPRRDPGLERTRAARLLPPRGRRRRGRQGGRQRAVLRQLPYAAATRSSTSTGCASATD